MLKLHTQIAQEEKTHLAPYAVASSDSLGRLHPETAHPYRTAFQRDRARIIHSAAFRRLDGKTQVFLNGTGDHYRTRLTHTIEVSSVSRTIARALALNEDLAEAIALAHDLGHPPFGHSGEETLHALMRGHGGFDHNIQSLRVVEVLEEQYPKYRGLNLSFEVIEGLKKHEKHLTLPPKLGGTVYFSTSLEGQIANLADEITYYSHDLDDGLESGLIEPEQLETLQALQAPLARCREDLKAFNARTHRGYLVRCLINGLVENLVTQSAQAIQKSGVTSVQEVRQRNRPLIGFSLETRRATQQLRKFLYQNLYHNPAVKDVNDRSCELLAGVFHYLVTHPNHMGSKARARIRREGLHRAVADYLAGMTDRYLLDQHNLLLGK